MVAGSEMGTYGYIGTDNAFGTSYDDSVEILLSMKRIERESHREISDDIREIMSVKAVA